MDRLKNIINTLYGNTKIYEDDSMQKSLSGRIKNAPDVVKNVSLKDLDIPDEEKQLVSKGIINDIASEIDSTNIGIVLRKDESPKASRGQGEIRLNVEPVNKISRDKISKELMSALDNTNGGLKVNSLSKGYSGHPNAPVLNMNYEVQEIPNIMMSEDDLEKTEDVDVQLRFKNPGSRSNMTRITKEEEEVQAYILYTYQPFFKKDKLKLSDVEDYIASNYELLDSDEWAPSIFEISNEIFGYNINSTYNKETIIDPSKEYYVFRIDYIPSNIYNHTRIKSIHKMINEALKKSINVKETQKDNWNPSDIYLCAAESYEKFVNEWEQALNTYINIEDFNDILIKYFNSKEVVGISLKKLKNGIISIAEKENFSKEEWYPRRKILRNRLSLQNNIVFIPELKYVSNSSENNSGLGFNLTYRNNLRHKYEIQEDNLEDGYNNNVISYCRYRSFNGDLSTTMSFETSDNYSASQNGKLSSNKLNDILNRYISHENFDVNLFNDDSLPLDERVYKYDEIVKYISNSGIHILQYKTKSPLNINTWSEYIRQLKEKNIGELRDTDIIAHNRLKDWPKTLKFLLGMSIASKYNDYDNNFSLKDFVCDVYYGSKKVGEGYAPFVKIC